MKYLSIFLLLLGSCSLFANEYQVGDHELLLMPTAYTMPKGASYFTDYELVFLNYTRAFTSTTHVGVFSLFPITTDFVETISVGVKQQYYRSTNVAGAFWSNYTPKIGLIMLGNVVSLGKSDKTFHLGVAGAHSKDSPHWEFFFLGGTALKASNRLTIIAEYSNSNSLIKDEEFKGLLSLGVRFRGAKISWELGGIRPLQSSGDFLFFPILKGTFYFK